MGVHTDIVLSGREPRSKRIQDQTLAWRERAIFCRPLAGIREARTPKLLNPKPQPLPSFCWDCHSNCCAAASWSLETTGWCTKTCTQCWRDQLKAVGQGSRKLSESSADSFCLICSSCLSLSSLAALSAVKWHGPCFRRALQDHVSAARLTMSNYYT